MTNDRSEALKKIGELIKDIRIAMMTTVGADGSLHSRPMATQEREFDGVLWFLTRGDSGKVYEIKHDAVVGLTYADGKQSFVSMSGRATVSRDQAKIEELWNPLYKAWFPEGKEDPEIRVLRVDAAEAEYWEAPSNAIVRNIKMLTATLTGGRTSVGENEKVELRTKP